MIHIDENDPEGTLEPNFQPRDVLIKRGVDAKELYELINEVGRGKFGTVYKCKEKNTGLELAAKFVPIPKREDRRNVEREVEIMNSLQHHLIIQLYAAYEYQKMMCVVLELVEGGELFDRVIDDDFILTEKACTVFIRQVCEAMEFIHRNNILHLDLKPENILCLTKEGNRIKIIDFGLARRYDPDKKLQVLFGTPEFVAPEVVNFDSISYGTDMWSVGVICYVLLSGLSPFMGETDIETMANVTIAKYDFDDEAFNNVSQEALDFITKLLVKDISARMTATECLEHKWLKRRPKPVVPPKPVIIQPTSAIVQQKHREQLEQQEQQHSIKDTKDTITPVSPGPGPIPTIIQTQDDSNAKELETTKDNLKNFIERWEEHPNSPYIFDNESNFIAPLRDVSADSAMSSRVCSPSPCESISSLESTTEETHTQMDDGSSTASEKLELEKDTDEDGRKTPHTPLLENNDFKHYLHSFDRRNSDTSYILGTRQGAEKLNLAEEIKKLSDHLLMLSEINTKLERENSEESNVQSSESASKKLDIIEEDKSIETPSTTTKDKIPTEKATDLKSNKETPSSTPTSTPTTPTTPTFKMNHGLFSRSFSQSVGDEHKTHYGSTLNKSTSVIKSSTMSKGTRTTSSSVTTTTTFSKIGGHIRTNVLSERLQSLEETPKITMNGKNEERSRSSENKLTKIVNGFKTTTPSNRVFSRSSTEATTYGVPWPVTNKRTKFRINQMSRDVPIGLPDTHQAYNLEDAANTTKDCLLHLLEKYNNTKMRNGPAGRHQSISVDWDISQNLEYRSMNSINAFFQRHTSSGRNVKQILAQLESKTQ